MSRRARHRAAAMQAKHVALVPLAALEGDDHDDHDDMPDDVCPHCLGDGMDPWNDYLLPCPLCQGEG